MMEGKVSMFSGHSGVGKSTLVNAIESGLSIRTAEISEQHQQGRASQQPASAPTSLPWLNRSI